jgi:hypothetical protein
VNVRLEWFEISRAALVGVSRNVEAMRKGCVQNLRGKDVSWEQHVVGALGECAFAKGTNRYWSGSVNTFKAADIGGNIQIRTRSSHHYDLIVRSGDSDADVFVLVTGGPAEFAIRGWMAAADAKQEQFRANYGNYGEAFFVPQSALHPIETLACKEVA